MGLISEVTPVFDFFSNLFTLLPYAIRQLAFMAFGCFLFILVLRSIWR